MPCVLDRMCDKSWSLILLGRQTPLRFFEPLPRIFPSPNFFWAQDVFLSLGFISGVFITFLTFLVLAYTIPKQKT